MDYYIAKNGTHQGPYSINQLIEMGITKDTLVYNESLTGWTPAGNVPELAGIFNNTGSAVSLPNGPRTVHNVPPAPEVIPPLPKTWLVESILVTLFCCLPFGIVGIIKASQVESLYRVGRYNESEQASREAGKWVKLSFFIGLGLGLIGVILQMIGFGYMGVFQSQI